MIIPEIQNTVEILEEIYQLQMDTQWWDCIILHRLLN